MEKNKSSKIPILDINLSAYQSLKGNPPELNLQGTRVVFLFNADEKFYRLSGEYNSNILVNTLDFVNAQRQLKAMMLSAKANGNGDKINEERQYNK